MKHIKKFNESTTELSFFEEEKEQLVNTIQELLNLYEDFSKTVAPRHWRSTGHHFTELKQMKEDIEEFQEITKEDKENDWVRNQISE